MTPEQLSALQMGQGIAHIQDPETSRTYLLIEQGQQPSLSDDYFCEKLNEGVSEAERGDSKPWDVEALKNVLRDRYSSE